MEELLRIFLERLEFIGESNEELFDTDVRQTMSNVIVDGFVRAEDNHVFPDEYGMFSAQANSDVKFALEQYVLAANETAKDLNIIEFHDRLAAVQNEQVRTKQGNDYEEFLGHSPPEYFDKTGRVIRTQ